MRNKPETKLVYDKKDLASLVAGDRVFLNIGAVTVQAAYVEENRFVTRFLVGSEPRAASYTVNEMNYDNEGSVVLKTFQAKNYDNFRQIPVIEYMVLIISGLVTE